MFTGLVVMMFVIATSTAQFDVYYAYPEQLYQAQTQEQLPSQLHQLQQPVEEPETALYLMARQPNTKNMYMNNQIGSQDSYNYQQANPPDYFQNMQNQNFYQNQQNQNYYQSQMNPNPPNMFPSEYTSCGNNVLPSNNCMNPVPSTTSPVSRPTDCTYSGGAARKSKNSEEEHTPAPSTTRTTTASTTHQSTTYTEEPPKSADTSIQVKIINSSIAPSKNVPDEKTQYFMHEKKRKIRVHSPQNKMFVRKLVNSSSKGKVLVPYRNTMSMINHAKDSVSLVHQ